jgi:hypothetical protein
VGHDINIHDELAPSQGLLFGEEQERLNYFPEVARNDVDAFKRVLSTPGARIGVDFEFDTRNLIPTIVGVATPELAVGMKWSQNLAGGLIDAAGRGKKLTAFSTMGADKPVLEKGMGVPGFKTPVDWWEDGMITHFLENQDFCKAPGKGESDDAGAMGFMNLWTATSMVSMVPRWKSCRGRTCSREICPKHDPLGYCAVDAWGGLVAHEADWKEIRAHNGITAEYYRDTMELAACCQDMQDKGVYVDMDYVRRMDADMSLKKSQLMPRELDIYGHPTSEWKWFNPMSPKQGLEWLGARGIKLESANKVDLQKTLISRCRALGYSGTGIRPIEEMQLDPAAELSEADLGLLYWYNFKSAGKGMGAWFNDNTVGPDGLAHPRFIVAGSSMTRLSSAKPNFQNIPARGWGLIVRAAIRAREKGWRILKCDSSNLEFRMCCYLAGFDPRKLGPDAFKWLIAQAPHDFAQGAEWVGWSARQLAKSVSHAGDYLEGLKLIDPADLGTSMTKRQIEAGALVVYLKKYMPRLSKDWLFRGKVVCFTGSNLAERMFGDKSYGNRKKALAIQEDVYFRNFWFLREWHMKILEEIEDRDYAQIATGHYLRLYEGGEDDCKHTVAFHGQGTSAQFVQEAMLHYYREGLLPVMQVHDELDWEIPPESEFGDDKINEMVQFMREESNRLPGFICPAKAKVGENWDEENTMRLVPYA